MAVSPAPKTGQNFAAVSKVVGWVKIGPNPSAACHAHQTRTKATIKRKGALKVSSHLIDSMPRTMKWTLMTQKIMKQRNSPDEMPRTGRFCLVDGSKPKMAAAVA